MADLSGAQARKLALLSQRLVGQKRSTDLETTATTIEHLGYVQIDTISVVERAHHHVLWSRNPHYKPAHLDTLVANKRVFEYWSHAASYLPMQDYRFTLPRKQAFKEGNIRHWFPKDLTLMASILQRIRNEGPLMAKDFDSNVVKTTGWESKPTKQALENLYMQGDLMITCRKNFHKVYDLTERVLPNDIDLSLPTPLELAKFRVLKYLKAHAFGNVAEITYQLKNAKSLVIKATNELKESGVIENCQINGIDYVVLTSSLKELNKRPNLNKAKILSPFDNLVIQRNRVANLFNFNYLLECYVPKTKRQFGYFTLPIMWKGDLVARADCKVDKSRFCLNVIHLVIESKLTDVDAFMQALDIELLQYATFNQCNSYQILKSSTNFA